MTGPIAGLGRAGLTLTYYGDDFTGSVDVMEALTAHGVRTVLFLDVPTPQQLAAYPGIKAVGVAGIGRTMSPARMDEELPPIFRRLKALDAPLFHYKVCSTFDSSATVGSIGRATEIARRVFGPQPVPMVIGAPILRRYCVFGNLFATADGITHRLDRHPTMRAHPVTPMDESDLRIALRRQTELPAALVDVLTLARGDPEVEARVDAAVKSGAQIILFDILDERSERAIGLVLDRLLTGGRDRGLTRIAVGSSGVEYALGAHWRATGGLSAPAWGGAQKPQQTLVIAGSRAPATEAQVAFALQSGFADVPVDPVRITDPNAGQAARAEVVAQALAAFRGGAHVLVETLRRTVPVDGTAIARAMGAIARAIAVHSGVRRMVVAGGDTSGMVTRSLGISALEILIPLTTGAPLCRVSSDRKDFDGMEICLKAGQIGAPDYFVRIARLGDTSGL